MMADYTPTTDQVREAWVATAISLPAESPAEFDRWLAAHDAEIRADERKQAAQRVQTVIDLLPANTRNVIAGDHADAFVAAARGEGKK